MALVGLEISVDLAYVRNALKIANLISAILS